MTQPSATAVYRVFDRRVRAPGGLPLVLDTASEQAPPSNLTDPVTPHERLDPIELCRDDESVDVPAREGLLLHDVQDFVGGPSLRVWRAKEWLQVDYDRWRIRWRAQVPRLYCSPEVAGLAHAPSHERFGFALALERVFLPLFLLLSSPDRLGLHGSAVRWQGRAYLFIGRSGAGKSTTAYELMRRGAQLMSDDLTLVEPGCMQMLGAAPALRLWREAGALPEALEDRGIWQHAQSKRWFRMPDGADAPQRAPLGAIIWLDPDGGATSDARDAHTPRLSELGRRDALVGLLRQTFDLSHPEPDWMRARFRAASLLVHACPMYRLSYQKSSDGQPRHVDALFQAIRSIHARSGGAPAPVEAS